MSISQLLKYRSDSKYLYNANEEISIEQNSCQQIKYLDCRNWFDFAEQLIIIVFSIYLFLHVLKHYINLKKQIEEGEESQLQKSIRRKILVNAIQLIYLLWFIFSTFFDVVLYFFYKDPKLREYLNSDGENSWHLDKIYKSTQVFYVNWLNCINVTVGFLYWKATRAFYVISDIKVPIFFTRGMKSLFVILFFINGIVIVIGCVALFSESFSDHVMQYCTLGSTLLSILICIFCRILYRKYILTKVELSKKVLIKEKVTSFLLFFSSFLRIFLYSYDPINPEWIQNIRNQTPNQEGQCYDNYIWYCFILLIINIGVNLLPAGIYGYLFVSQVDFNSKRSQRTNPLLLSSTDDV